MNTDSDGLRSCSERPRKVVARHRKMVRRPRRMSGWKTLYSDMMHLEITKLLSAKCGEPPPIYCKTKLMMRSGLALYVPLPRVSASIADFEVTKVLGMPLTIC